jgi:hypothetical protein
MMVFIVTCLGEKGYGLERKNLCMPGDLYGKTSSLKGENYSKPRPDGL